MIIKTIRINEKRKNEEVIDSKVSRIETDKYSILLNPRTINSKAFYLTKDTIRLECQVLKDGVWITIATKEKGNK